MTAEAPDPGAVRALLAEVGEDAGELELSPVEGGASRQTFMVAAEGVPRYVVRREPAEGMSFATLELELRAIAGADLAGVTVARTVAADLMRACQKDGLLRLDVLRRHMGGGRLRHRFPR